jgi:quercetin dioxygenase-like cupin family protein
LLARLLQLGFLKSSSQISPIGSGVYHWKELDVKKDKQRESRNILAGSTNEFSWFEIHATTQEKGAVPKTPHKQEDVEELIIIKEGILKCTIGTRTATLDAGGVLLIPPGEMQSFENTSDGPATYYVLQFRSKKAADMERSAKAGGVLFINDDTLLYTEKNKRGTRKYFNRPTATCENFEMHVTTLFEKGPSHAAHTHVDTEIILVITGEVEMTIDGKYYKAEAGDLFIAESGKLHGVGNASEKPCSYFAFKWR